MYFCGLVISAQEVYLGTRTSLMDSPSLGFVKNMVASGIHTRTDAERALRRWRWVGCGTKYAFMVLLILVYGYVDSRPDIRKRFNDWIDAHITIKLKRAIAYLF